MRQRSSKSFLGLKECDVRNDDVRLAGLLAAADCDVPEARRWMDSFNILAIAHCRRFGHTLEDAEDLVQSFWLWVYARNPARVFSQYSPDRGSLLSFALLCIRHAVARPGRQMADLRRLWDALDEELAVPADSPSPLDVLLESERKERAVRNPREVEALRRVNAGLNRLGTEVGEAGWLLCELHVRRRKYLHLAEDLFGTQGAPAQRKRQLSALRQRAFKASQRFVRFLAAERDTGSQAARNRSGRETARRRVSSADAARLLGGLGVACLADPRLPDEALLGYVYRDLRGDERSRVTAHLAACPYCSEQVTHLRRTIKHFATPSGRERLRRLWSSFREASGEMRRDVAQPGRRGKLAAAAARTHDGYRATLTSENVPTWAALAEDLKLSNYHQVTFAKHLLRSVGLSVREVRGRQIVPIDLEKKLGEATLRRLAELEHERFVAERTLQGWSYGKTKDIKKKRSPYLVAWDRLEPAIQELDIRAVRALPETLREQGFEVSHRKKTL
jgi:DNA-directed RNA polymerase specialized sigma24 family protein